MYRSILTLTFLILALPYAALAQGTRSVLRCAFTGSLDVHATQDPGSPVIGKVACGSSVQFLDNRTGAPHIRLEDGKDGYLTGSTLGWAIDPGTGAAPITSPRPTVPGQPATTPQRPDPKDPFGTKNPNRFSRKYEIGIMASYWRDSGAEYGGANVSLVTNINDRFGIVARLDAHQDLDFPSTKVYSPTIGLRSYLLRTRPVAGFLEAGFGGFYATNGSSSTNGYSQRVGGAIDLNITSGFHWRMIEVNHTFLHTSGNNSGGVQVATGLAFRFGRE